MESGHNSIHLAVGGFDYPGLGSDSPISGANGDIGENDTAGFDPIFFFHHCFIDRVFWLWQKRHGKTGGLEIIPEYPGTNSVDGAGPTAGVQPNVWLNMETSLDPFLKVDGTPYRSIDVVNIETQMGYTYGPGSLEGGVFNAYDQPVSTVHVSGLSRGAIRGLF